MFVGFDNSFIKKIDLEKRYIDLETNITLYTIIITRKLNDRSKQENKWF